MFTTTDNKQPEYKREMLAHAYQHDAVYRRVFGCPPVRDFRGTFIRPGSLIAYPERKGVKMALCEGLVIRITEEPGSIYALWLEQEVKDQHTETVYHTVRRFTHPERCVVV